MAACEMRLEYCECLSMQACVCKRHRQRQYYSSRYHGGLRYVVLKRDGYKCVCCNSQHYLNVHHVDGNRHNNEDPSNQVALCCRCHARIERSIVFICRAEEADQKRLKLWLRLRPQGRFQPVLPMDLDSI